MKSGRVVSLQEFKNGAMMKLGSYQHGMLDSPVRTWIAPPTTLDDYRCPASLLEQKDFLKELRKKQRPEANMLKALAAQSI